MNPHSSYSLNSRSIKTKFTVRFISALKKIANKRPTSCSSSEEISRRFKRVKLAADASMASAVGPRKAWSRAILIKHHNRSHARVHALTAHRRETDHDHAITIRKRVMRKRKVQKLDPTFRTNELRRLVPGGEAMDLYSLLDETAHYIKCLTTQVKVMRSIANYCAAGASSIHTS
ncbi:hypothetical protein Ancab_034059 [Ancistrocladus abbreviatus]